MSRFTDVIGRLADTIESRRDGDTSTSYTAQLLADIDRAAKKMGEEAVETVIAAAGVSLDEVAEKLEQREGMSGLVEKAARV